MGHKVSLEIYDVFSDIMGTRLIIVPPISIEKMVEYLAAKAKDEGFSFCEGCGEYLERGIIEEKNDGRFYGFQTLDKLFCKIVYEKIKDDSKKGIESPLITPDQLRNFLQIRDHEAESEQLLKDMVGMDDILKEIDDKIKQVKVQKKLCDEGKKINRPSIHMMFTGNPGTGKTTMARIVAAKLKEAGILRKGNLLEIKGRDLCGEYIGQTTPTTNAICRDAYGSVLLIDEAYELYRDNGPSNDYGREALTALIAEMENHRDDMCVIMAGYTEDMKEMLHGNAGLRDRIPIHIDFPNYTREQLTEIFFRMIDGNFEYEEKLREAVSDYFNSLNDEFITSKEFSNGRFVRNLFEHTWGETATRYDIESNELVVTSNDFIRATKKVMPKDMVYKKESKTGYGNF
jgi:SpoVK/Ycf46/Vps4 family AAA+-type ATPase